MNHTPPIDARALRPRAALSLSFGFSALLLASSLAQTAPAPSGDEVIQLSEFQVSAQQDRGYRASNSVSATRINTPIKDLPFAVNAFTQQFITDIGARDLFDIVQYAPGVTSSGREFNAGNAMYTIRGFDQRPQRNGFVGDSYVDTVSIERVEVVKGPASVLYGQVAPGGTVNYITKRPTAKPFTTVSGEIGSYDFWRTTLDLNQPIAGKTVLFRFNGALENGFQNVDPSKAKTWVIDPSVTFNLTDRISLNVDYQWFHRRETPPAQFKPNISVPGLKNNATGYDPGFLGYFPLPRDFNYASANDWRRADFESLNAELYAKLSDQWSGRANFNWNKTRDAQKLTGIGTVTLGVPKTTTAAAFAAAILADPGVAASATSAILNRRKRLQEDFGHGNAVQAEVVGNYRFDWGKLKPLFGAYYGTGGSYSRIRQSGGKGYPNFANWDFIQPVTINNATDFDPVTLPFTTYSHSITHSQAAYTVLNGSFLQDRISAVLGARYNRVDAQTDNVLTHTPGTKFTANRTTPQFGVGYKLAPDVMVYGSYSQSFVQNAASLQLNSQPAGPAKPTTSEGYELGVKTDLLQGRISSTISVYQIDQKDRVVNFTTLDPALGTLRTTTQGTTDRSRGVEAEVVYSPTDNLQVYASIAEDDIRVINEPAGLSVFLGSHPEATVKTLCNLWTRYTITADGWLKGAWIGAGANYVGKKAQRADNPALFLPSYTLWNATLGYDWKLSGHPLTTTLAWQNIGNVEYYPANQQRGLPGRVVFSTTATF